MNHIAFATGISFIAALLASYACSDDNSPAAPAAQTWHDAALGDANKAEIMAVDGAKACNAYGAPKCGTGETCCFSNDLSSACTELSACTSSFQIQC
jgi:hypothetical protein